MDKDKFDIILEDFNEILKKSNQVEEAQKYALKEIELFLNAFKQRMKLEAYSQYVNDDQLKHASEWFLKYMKQMEDHNFKNQSIDAKKTLKKLKSTLESLEDE